MSNTVLSLQLANAQLKEEKRALLFEIRKLQAQKAKFEAKNVSLEAEMVAARLRIKEYEKKYKADDGKPYDPVDTARRLRFMFAQITHANYKIIGPDGLPVTD